MVTTEKARRGRTGSNPPSVRCAVSFFQIPWVVCQPYAASSPHERYAASTLLGSARVREASAAALQDVLLTGNFGTTFDFGGGAVASAGGGMMATNAMGRTGPL